MIYNKRKFIPSSKQTRNESEEAISPQCKLPKEILDFYKELSPSLGFFKERGNHFHAGPILKQSGLDTCNNQLNTDDFLSFGAMVIIPNYEQLCAM